ncbi:hypothetical protein [Azospirillum sp. TSO22-1]|uniref:hypothetical protein n=1 Tax=Azospirillum sp. TSO22-1 TaxID=716789 RepID=UPI000D606537|nr:hypothetical protein [Azospirillum sp. TSO22-1]PWC38805.1 hypothetical protein TSO221_26145 [Azospirillum sp. TSO22-1]
MRFAETLLILAGIAALHAALVLTGVVPALEGGQVNLFDPDSYTRLLRVAQLHATGRWYDPVLTALNAPAGLELHWTRPLDALMLVLAAPLSLALPFPAALEWAGLVMAPALHGVAALLLWFGSRPLLNRAERALAVLLFVALRAPLGDFVAGFSDHHALVMVLALGQLAAFLNGRMAVAGAAAGLGIWVSPECLLLLPAPLAALALGWVRDDGDATRDGVRFCAGLLGALAVGLALERPPAQWLMPDAFRLSALHAGLGALLLAAVGAVSLAARRTHGPAGRAFTALAAAMGAAGAAWLLLPGLFANPQDGLDPVVRAYLLDPVGIEDPLRLAEVNWGDLLLDAGPVLPALLCAGVAAARGPAAQRRGWLFLLLALLLMLAYVLFGKARGLHFLALYQAIPWSAATVRLWRHGGAAVAAAALVGGGSWIAGAALASTAPPPPPAAECRYGPVTPHLPPPRPGETVLSDLFDGPELAYRSGYGAIGAPYDLNAAGIRDTQALLLGDPRSGTVRRLLEERRVAVIVLCRGRSPDVERELRDRPRSLLALLHRLSPPPGIEPIALPAAEAQRFLAYRVAR